MCLVVAVSFSPTMRSDFSHPKLDDDRRCSPFDTWHRCSFFQSWAFPWFSSLFRLCMHTHIHMLGIAKNKGRESIKQIVSIQSLAWYLTIHSLYSTLCGSVQIYQIQLRVGALHCDITFIFNTHTHGLSFDR